MKKIIFAMLFAVWSVLCTAHTQGDEAAAAHSADQASPLKSIQFGPYKITALHDGDTVLNAAVFDQNFSQQEVQAIFQGQSADPVKPVQTSVNAFLIEDDLRNLTLIDSGAGNCEGNHRGAAVQQMATAGYKTSDVGTVLLTHLHPDHVCGIENQTKAVFPFATVYVSEKELSYWLSENTLALLTADQQAQYKWTAAQIKAALAPYNQKRSVRTFKVGAVINGIEAVESAGHTPGHFLYQLQYQGRHLVFVGDIAHSANLQFEYPALSVNFDFDPVQSGKNREHFFKDYAAQDSLIAAAHLPFPGIGKIKQNKAGSFEWSPIGSPATPATSAE